MEFTLALKALWERRRLVAAGAVVCAVLAALVAFRGLPTDPASRQVRVWQASAQILIDADPSVVGDLGQGLDPLIPRAGVYANLMTSPALASLIAHAADIPASAISIVGPIGSNGQRPTYRPTGASGPPTYGLQLNADPVQPIIRVIAQGPNARGALALANGASAGLAAYVRQAQAGADVPRRHRVSIHQLGPASESATETGVAPLFVLPIFLALSIAWCMLVLFAVRFRATWRLAGMPLREGAAEDLFPDDERRAATSTATEDPTVFHDGLAVEDGYILRNGNDHAGAVLAEDYALADDRPLADDYPLPDDCGLADDLDFHDGSGEDRDEPDAADQLDIDELAVRPSTGRVAPFWRD